MSQQSYHSQTATGADINFTIDTFSSDELKVYVDGVLKTAGVDYNINPYNSNSQSTVDWLGTAPSSPSIVRIIRETDVLNNGNTAVEGRATYEAGSSVKADDLNNNQIQVLRGLQERQDQKIQRYDIEDGEVVRSKIAADAIDGTKIADDVINSEHYVAGSIDLEHMSPNSVDSDQYVDGSIDHVHLANDIIDGDNIQDDVINSEHYVAGSIDEEHIANLQVTRGKIANDAINGTKIADDSIDSEHYVDRSIDTQHIGGSQVTTNELATNAVTTIKITDGNVTRAKLEADIIDGTKLADNAVNSEHYTDGSIDHVHLANDVIDGDNIQDDVVNSEHIAAGALDNEHYATGSITSDKLNGATVITASEQAAATTNDTSFLTSAAADARFFNISTGDTIKDGDTFPDNDTTIATTAAINDRIIDLVDDVGGFVPIANEESFPAANPDINLSGSTKGGTIVSVKAATTNLTAQSGTTLTIANGRGTGNAVIITGVSSTIPSGFGFLVETTQVDHTYAFHRLVPKATEVTTVAGISSNITTVAGIASNVTTVAGISSNVTSVAGNATNINAVAGNASNINAVAADAADIGVVAADGTDIGLVAGSITNVNNVGGSIANVNTVAGNLSGVNYFGNRYRVDSSEPGTNNDAGDLYFDTSSNELRVYNGSAWQGGVTATGNLAGLGANSFTGNQTIQNTQPKLSLVDTNSNPDYDIINADGIFQITDTTNSANRFRIDGTGTANVTGNLDVGAGVDVTGNITVTGNVDGRDVAADGAKLDGIATSATANPNALDNVVEDTSPQLGGTLDTNGNLITFGDSSGASDDRLKFGASGDLQIYHDSNNSILENSTGQLKLKASTNNRSVQFIDHNDNAMIQALSGGAVTIAHNGSTKLATTSSGVNVTGNFAATGDLTIDTSTLKVDSSNNRVGIGTTSPDSMLHLKGGVPAIYLEDTDGTFGQAIIEQSSDSLQIRQDAGNASSGSSNINFQIDAAERMRLTTTGLGIGTTSPAMPLHIKGNTPYIRFEDDNDNQDWEIEARAFFGIYDVTDSAFRLAIDGDGNVGIGTTSPQSGGLTVERSGEARLQVRANSDGSNGIVALRADGGNTQLGTWSDHNLKFVRNSSTKFELTSSGGAFTGNFTCTGTFDGKDVSTLIANVLEDTSPQLGGNLDVNGYNVLFGDSSSGGTNLNRLKLGASNDLHIYHDSSGNNFVLSANNHPLVLRAGTGSAYLQGNTVWLGDAGQNHTYLKGIQNGATELYNDNVLKLKTGVSGQYGSVDVFNGANSWNGYSIGGQFVFMSDGATCGIYNDIDNAWMIEAYRNSYVRLRDNGSVKLQTSSSGVTVTGTCTAGTFSGSGASLTSIPAGQLTGTLPAISGANLTNLPGGGKILQVVRGSLNGSFGTGSGSFQATGCSVSITMTDSNNKVYVLAGGTVNNTSADEGGKLTVYRGSTNIATHGDNIAGYWQDGGSNNVEQSIFMSALDTPGSGTHTYQVYMKAHGGTMYYGYRNTGIITVMEVDA